MALAQNLWGAWDLAMRMREPAYLCADIMGEVKSESRSVVSTSLWPHGLYSPQNSPGQNTGVGSLSLLQGSSQPRDRIQVSHIAGGFFTSWATWEKWVSNQDSIQSQHI